MDSHPFQRFIDLIAFDQEVRALLHKKEQLAQEMVQIKQQLAYHEELYAKSQRLLKEARKHVDTCELEMKELVQKEQNKKKKLEQLTTYKESQALQKEVDTIRSQQHELEDSLLHAWHVLETCEREKNEQAKRYQEKEEEAYMLLAQKKQEQETVVAVLATHEHQREEKKQSVPHEWLDKYEAMRLHVTDPVVPIEGNNCSACFHELSHHEIMRLARGALMPCKSCFRLLYSKNKMPGG